MIRVNVADIFPIAISLVDISDNPIIGETVYYDIRHTDDSALNPPNNGILIESTVASGIYKQNVSIDTAGTYICYITCSNYPTHTKSIIVNQETVADSVWSTTVALQLLDDVEFIKDVEGGRWKIENNQLFLYKEDNVTHIATFNLFNKSSDPAEVDVYERVRI
jgi:hypothetical protein